MIHNNRRSWENNFAGWTPPVCEKYASEEGEEDERKEENKAEENCSLKLQN